MKNSTRAFPFEETPPQQDGSDRTGLQFDDSFFKTGQEFKKQILETVKPNRESAPTRIRSAAVVMQDAEKLPPLKRLFGNFWKSGEISILAADTNVGKSILACQVGETIGGGLPSCVEQSCEAREMVLYYDLELSDRQFLERFKGRNFPDNFKRVDLDPGVADPTFGIAEIRADVEYTGATAVIIDNLSALSLKTTADADAALSVMRGLKTLQLETGVSILAIAHIPKLPLGVFLNTNHLAGSKAIANFADSIFFLGKSRQSKTLRYLKQTKCRNGELPDEPMIMELTKDPDGLRFKFRGYAPESEHVEQPQQAARSEKQDEIQDKKQRVWDLSAQGYTVKAINDLTGFSTGSISSYLKERPAVQCSENNEHAEQPRF